MSAVGGGGGGWRRGGCVCVCVVAAVVVGRGREVLGRWLSAAAACPGRSPPQADPGDGCLCDCEPRDDADRRGRQPDGHGRQREPPPPPGPLLLRRRCRFPLLPRPAACSSLHRPSLREEAPKAQECPATDPRCLPPSPRCPPAAEPRAADAVAGVWERQGAAHAVALEIGAPPPPLSGGRPGGGGGGGSDAPPASQSSLLLLSLFFCFERPCGAAPPCGVLYRISLPALSPRKKISLASKNKTRKAQERA